jgi:hypothetical protein
MALLATLLVVILKEGVKCAVSFCGVLFCRTAPLVIVPIVSACVALVYFTSSDDGVW